MHAATYAVLYALGWLSFPGSVFRWPLFVGLLCYGVLIEILQLLTGYRFMEFWDVVANTSGLGLGCLGIIIAQRFLPSVVLAMGGVLYLESELKSDLKSDRKSSASHNFDVRSP